MRNIFVIGVFLLIGFFVAQDTYAATLYIDPHDAEVYPGDTIALAVRIDTDEGECINVIDGTLEFSDNITPVDVSLGDSIFPLWVQAPEINKNSNTVSFAGGIPNGYCGRIDGDPRLTNVILELIVQAPGLQIGIGKRESEAHVSFAPSTRAFLNDNAGTEASLSTIDAEIYIHKNPRGIITNEWGDRIDVDNTPPSEFSITLTSEPTIYSGKHFIVFNSTDKQSGIDHYEVIEESLSDFGIFKWGAVDAPWKVARSPYVLEDQSLNSTIRVKAVDKAGNEYIAVYIPPESMRVNRPLPIADILLIAGVALLILMVLGLAAWFYVRRTRRYRQGVEHNEPLQDLDVAE